jgi:tetratricopeptide (TPR) repeat protein
MFNIIKDIIYRKKKVADMQLSQLCKSKKEAGDLQMKIGQFEQAASLYQETIALCPEYAEAQVNLSNACRELGAAEMAEHALRKAISIKPELTIAYYNLATLLSDQARDSEALPLFERVIALAPDHADAHVNIAILMIKLGRRQEALEILNHALKFETTADIYCRRGNLLMELKRYDGAIASFEEAIAVENNHALSHFCLGMCKLLKGDFTIGLPEYEWRFKVTKFRNLKREYPQPQWTGNQPLEGKTILIQCEQGFGDTIQFVRYIDLLAQNGAKIILAAQQPLIPVLNTFKNINTLLPLEGPLPNFDYHSPLLSLPLAFKTTLETIPSQTPYLYSNQSLATEYQAFLPSSAAPRIGIVWSGSDLGKNDWNRSVPLTQFMNIFKNKNVSLISLQKDVRPEDQAALATSNITHLGNKLKDFGHTAAIISCMDLIISIDTSVAHLAGAMNKPTWILLNDNADWRWFQNREDSPWYQSAKLFRQSSSGNWGDVINNVSANFNEFIGNFKSC